MGSELIIKNVSIRGIGSNNRGVLEAELVERESIIAMHRARIFMLAAATPRAIITPSDQFTDANTVHWEDYIYSELSECLDEIGVLSAECRLLQEAISFPEDTEVSV